MSLYFNIPITSRFAATVKKVLDFSALPSGWHFGEGEKISADTVADALVLLDMASPLSAETKADAFPGLHGEARVCFYRGDDYFEFTIDRSRRIEFLHEKLGVEKEHKQSWALHDAIIKIFDTVIPPWPSYVYSHSGIGMRFNVGSKASGSVQAAGSKEGASQSSTKTALKERGLVSVNTSDGFTSPYLESRQSTGKYQSFPLVAA